MVIQDQRQYNENFRKSVYGNSDEYELKPLKNHTNLNEDNVKIPDDNRNENFKNELDSIVMMQHKKLSFSV